MMSRRRFCGSVAAATVGGLAVVVTGCSSGDGAVSTAGSADASGLLAGVDVRVHRDPG